MRRSSPSCRSALNILLPLVALSMRSTGCWAKSRISKPGFDRTVALGAITDQLGSLCGPKLWLLAKLGDVVTEIVDVDQASERMDGGDTVVH